MSNKLQNSGFCCACCGWGFAQIWRRFLCVFSGFLPGRWNFHADFLRRFWCTDFFVQIYCVGYCAEFRAQIFAQLFVAEYAEFCADTLQFLS